MLCCGFSATAAEAQALLAWEVQFLRDGSVAGRQPAAWRLGRATKQRTTMQRFCAKKSPALVLGLDLKKISSTSTKNYVYRCLSSCFLMGIPMVIFLASIFAFKASKALGKSEEFL